MQDSIIKFVTENPVIILAIVAWIAFKTVSPAWIWEKVKNLWVRVSPKVSAFSLTKGEIINLATLAGVVVLLWLAFQPIPDPPTPIPGPSPPPVIVIPPKPDPVDPPEPPPVPAPIAVEGNRVLILYETADIGKLPVEQLKILTSTKLRAWLATKCAKGPDGRTAEYRVYDKDVQLSMDSSIWDAAAKLRGEGKLPWICISTGKTGFMGDLPATEEATFTLLRKYFGD